MKIGIPTTYTNILAVALLLEVSDLIEECRKRGLSRELAARVISNETGIKFTANELNDAARMQNNIESLRIFEQYAKEANRFYRFGDEKVSEDRR